jgi:uncharacterized damage-inducible protein DinB
MATGDRDMALAALEHGRQIFLDDVEGLTLGEALDTAGGYRSILGLIKHTAGWTAVYHSYAFADTPVPWESTDWPRGLRETIDPSEDYLHEVLEWFERGSQSWLDTVRGGVDLDEPRPTHWGENQPLREIVANVATHWAYHAGEINLILAVRRREAWEYGEHVEENHIATLGRSVRREWDTDEEVERVEAQMRQAARVGRSDR